MTRAVEEGYELAYGQESIGSNFFGLLIFVKMSERKLDGERDGLLFYKTARELKRGLETVSAEIDPKAVEMREATDGLPL